MILIEHLFIIEQHLGFPGAVPECPEIELMSNLQDLIRQNYRYEHHVSFYLKQLNTSYYYLNNRCRYYFGKSISELIEERLFRESYLLLSYTLTSVKVIGYELGFSDPSNFVRFFKRFAGTSPARFRKMDVVVTDLSYRRDDGRSR